MSLARVLTKPSVRISRKTVFGNSPATLLRGSNLPKTRLWRHSGIGRYQRLHVLESEDRSYGPVILAKNSEWRIMERVQWWISPAPWQAQPRDYRYAVREVSWTSPMGCFFLRVILLPAPSYPGLKTGKERLSCSIPRFSSTLWLLPNCR